MRIFFNESNNTITHRFMAKANPIGLNRIQVHQIQVLFTDITDRRICKSIRKKSNLSSKQ